MSGGTSTPWLATLCGVVMAFSVLGTGCAVDATGDDADDAEDIAAEAPSDLTVGQLTPGGLQVPKIPVKGALTKVTAQSDAPTGKASLIVDPLPEPWVPGGREDPRDGVDPDKTPSRSDDNHK